MFLFLLLAFLASTIRNVQHNFALGQTNFFLCHKSHYSECCLEFIQKIAGIAFAIILWIRNASREVL